MSNLEGQSNINRQERTESTHINDEGNALSKMSTEAWTAPSKSAQGDAPGTQKTEKEEIKKPTEPANSVKPGSAGAGQADSNQQHDGKPGGGGAKHGEAADTRNDRKPGGSGAYGEAGKNETQHDGKPGGGGAKHGEGASMGDRPHDGKPGGDGARHADGGARVGEGFGSRPGESKQGTEGVPPKELQKHGTQGGGTGGARSEQLQLPRKNHTNLPGSIEIPDIRKLM